MRRMGFLGGSLIPRGGVLRGVGGGWGVGVGLLFEEGGFFLEGVVGFLVVSLCMVELLLDCDNSSIIVVGRFCLFPFCRRHRLSSYVIVPCHFTAYCSIV